ncbi:MAG: ATP-binding cassette domain-containing protein, partial [Desulfobulbales bacterium]
MINIQYLSFSYPSGEFRLDIDKLSVASGEKVAFVGPSGSGKTTLLNLVAGILPSKSGSIKVDDDEINTLEDSSRRNFRITNIGFIFQDFGLLDYLDVRDNILHPYRITDALKLDSGVRGRVDMLAEQMGIADKLLRHPSDLSHGERQRV